MYGDLTGRLGDLAHEIGDTSTLIMEALVEVETRATAEQELRWVTNGLATFGREIPFFRDRIPLGSVFVSLPATLPLYSFVIAAVAPAFAGNRVVVRPSRRTASQLSRVIKLIRLPRALSIRISHDPWPAFVTHANRSADAFVYAGSWEHAEQLAEQLHERVKLIYNGPGVCPFVVGPQANIRECARAVLRTRLFNSGQDCLATERVYVHRTLASEFIEELLLQADSLVVSDNHRHDTSIGPLLFPESFTATKERLESADGVIACLRKGEDFGDGLWGLSVFECEPDSPMVLEEKFGPLLPLVRYGRTSELLELIHRGRFALGVTVFGEKRIASSLRFGHVALEKTLFEIEDAHRPFGGYKESSFVREGGMRRAGPVLLSVETTRPTR